jgi:hypothetical protein
VSDEWLPQRTDGSLPPSFENRSFPILIGDVLLSRRMICDYTRLYSFGVLFSFQGRKGRIAALAFSKRAFHACKTKVFSYLVSSGLSPEKLVNLISSVGSSYRYFFLRESAYGLKIKKRYGCKLSLVATDVIAYMYVYERCLNAFLCLKKLNHKIFLFS